MYLFHHIFLNKTFLHYMGKELRTVTNRQYNRARKMLVTYAGIYITG